MPAAYHRRSAPRVVAGEVRKKNNWVADRGNIYRWTQSEIVVHREKPGDGYRHVVSVRDVQRYFELLPDRDRLAVGLDAIVLARGAESEFGSYRNGVVKLRAWPNRLSMWTLIADSPEFFGALTIRRETNLEYPGWTLMHFSEQQARAYLLLDVLTHEIGHHVDRLTTRRQRDCGRGEPFAVLYARDAFPLLWSRYCDAFGMP